MATSQSQRLGIWVITIILAIGTLGSFMVMGLSINNQDIDAAQQQKVYEDYLEQQKIASKKYAESAEPLDGYEARKFDADSVKELKVEVLVEGNGEVIKATDSINSSYFGWTSDGKIFDSSNRKDAEDSPITFSLGGVISGWTEGLTGIKAGSTVRLTIPSEKAYGATGSGAIEPNSPLEFIVTVHKIDNETENS